MLDTKRFRDRVGLAVAACALVGAVMLVGGCGDDKSNGSNLDPRFDPATVTIVVGDSIRFVAVSGDHTVTSGTGAADPNSGLLFDEELPEGDTYTRAFSTQGTFPFYCIPHEADGMTGTITVAAAAPKTVEVFASGSAFNPSTIEINPGDAVKWTVNGSHTITSGTGLADPLVGDIFDEARSTGQTYTHTFDDLGSFEYFCRLHVGLGMTGTINVVEREIQTVEVEALE